MKRILFLFICPLLAVACNKRVVADYNVIPQVQNLSVKDGDVYVFDSSRKLVYDNQDSRRSLELFAQDLEELVGIRPSVAAGTSEDAKDNVYFTLGLQDGRKEAYSINVSSDGILVRAVSPEGIYRATRTLLKSVGTEKHLRWSSRQPKCPTGPASDTGGLCSMSADIFLMLRW